MQQLRFLWGVGVGRIFPADAERRGRGRGREKEREWEKERGLDGTYDVPAQIFFNALEASLGMFKSSRTAVGVGNRAHHEHDIHIPGSLNSGTASTRSFSF